MKIKESIQRMLNKQYQLRQIATTESCSRAGQFSHPATRIIDHTTSTLTTPISPTPSFSLTRDEVAVPSRLPWGQGAFGRRPSAASNNGPQASHRRRIFSVRPCLVSGHGKTAVFVLATHPPAARPSGTCMNSQTRLPDPQY